MSLTVVEASDAFRGLTPKQTAQRVLEIASANVERLPDDVIESSIAVLHLTPSGLSVLVPNELNTLEVLGLLEAGKDAVLDQFLGGGNG